MQAVYPALRLQPQQRLLHDAGCRSCAPVKPRSPDFCIHICSNAVLHGHASGDICGAAIKSKATIAVRTLLNRTLWPPHPR